MTRPSKSLLQGMVYTPAAHTDIRKTFERVRQQQQQQPAKVHPIKQTKGAR